MKMLVLSIDCDTPKLIFDFIRLNYVIKFRFVFFNFNPLLEHLGIIKTRLPYYEYLGKINIIFFDNFNFDIDGGPQISTYKSGSGSLDIFPWNLDHLSKTQYT